MKWPIFNLFCAAVTSKESLSWTKSSRVPLGRCEILITASVLARAKCVQRGSPLLDLLVGRIRHQQLRTDIHSSHRQRRTCSRAAFRNVRRAPEQRVLEIVPHPEKGDQVTCGPGPFSMASPDLVSAQLLKAGFQRPCFERFDADISIGQTVDEAVGLGMEVGPAGEILRLAGADADRYRADVIRTLRKLCGEWATPQGVKGRSSSWIVSAYAPMEHGN